jgi:hypothetical protein
MIEVEEEIKPSITNQITHKLKKANLKLEAGAFDRIIVAGVVIVATAFTTYVLVMLVLGRC